MKPKKNHVFFSSKLEISVLVRNYPQHSVLVVIAISNSYNYDQAQNQ